MSKIDAPLIWVWPVRCLHWLLVLSVVCAWLTRSWLGPWHAYFGYVALGVVSLRIYLGLRSQNCYVRFDQFVRSFEVTRGYARSVLMRHAHRHLGHNPLGGCMIVALLATIGLLGLTGWLYTTDWFWGDGWLANLHAAIGWLLICLIVLHIGGVLLSSVLHRENLVLSMFTGHKRALQGSEVRPRKLQDERQLD